MTLIPTCATTRDAISQLLAVKFGQALWLKHSLTHITSKFRIALDLIVQFNR